MTSFALIVLPILVILIWLHVWRRLAWATRATRPVKWAAAAFTGVLVLGSIAAVATSRGLAEPARWRWLTATGLAGVAVTWYLILGLWLLGIASLVWRGVNRAQGHRDAAGGLPRRVRWLRRGTVAVIAGSLAVTGYGLVEADRVAITPVTFTSPDLPQPFDGLKVAVISDVHVGPGVSGAFLRRIVDQVNAEHVDLVVLAGDMIDGSVASLAEEMQPVRDLSSTYGTVFITGNHELYSNAGEWLTFWPTLGVTDLSNDALVLTRGGASIDVLGINDATATGPITPDLRVALQRAAEKAGRPASTEPGADAGRFRLLAAHQPRQALDEGGLAAKAGIDLQVSGHTHGGQLWPFGYLVRLQQPVISGLGDVGGVPVYASRGAGTWGPPVRVGAPPEIPVITLTRA